jgi:hypothetical protein
MLVVMKLELEFEFENEKDAIAVFEEFAAAERVRATTSDHPSGRRTLEFDRYLAELKTKRGPCSETYNKQPAHYMVARAAPRL